MFQCLRLTLERRHWVLIILFLNAPAVAGGLLNGTVTIDGNGVGVHVQSNGAGVNAGVNVGGTGTGAGVQLNVPTPNIPNPVPPSPQTGNQPQSLPLPSEVLRRGESSIRTTINGLRKPQRDQLRRACRRVSNNPDMNWDPSIVIICLIAMSEIGAGGD